MTSQKLSILLINSLFHLQLFMSVLLVHHTQQPCGRKTPLVILSINFHTQATQLIGCLLYHCRVLTRSELAPLRASLVPMEHCITRFFNECDPNKDKHITLKEWGHCFGIKEGKFTSLVQTNPEPCRPPRARSCCAFKLKPRRSKVAAFRQAPSE